MKLIKVYYIKQSSNPGTHLKVDWQRMAKLLNAGLNAVKDIEKHTKKDIETLIHIAQPENVAPWFESVILAGLDDFDTIGASYYPHWSTYSFA